MQEKKVVHNRVKPEVLAEVVSEVVVAVALNNQDKVEIQVTTVMEIPVVQMYQTVALTTQVVAAVVPAEQAAKELEVYQVVSVEQEEITIFQERQ